MSWARLSEPPPFTNRRRRHSQAQKAGLRYERQAHEHFGAEFGEEYVAGPWFAFASLDGRVRYCQPDALVVSPHLGQVLVLEYKLRHTADAWWQTRLLYTPVLERAFPRELWEMKVCEVVGWYDPETVLPEPVRLAPHPVDSRANAFNVHIWKARKRYEY